MVSQKGLYILIQSLTKVKSSSEVTFSISGTGPELKSYQNLAKKLKVDHFIRWLGLLNRGEIIQAYQNCDVFILPSRHEGLPVSVIEAMACGKPVITTRCGGPEELVTDKTGIVVEQENPEKLASAIERMIESYQQYDAQAIRQIYLDNYSSKVVCRQYRALYQQVIDENETVGQHSNSNWFN